MGDSVWLFKYNGIKLSNLFVKIAPKAARAAVALTGSSCDAMMDGSSVLCA